MAYDFPNSPTVGQVYQGYTWDGTKWVHPVPYAPGHIPGQPGAGSPAAGEVGEYIYGATVGGGDVPGFNFTASASSPVLSATAHGLYPYTAIMFVNSGGALPGGLVGSTIYYVLGGAALTPNTFQVATTIANALAGTAITMTSAGSGTNSTAYGYITNAVAKDVMALLLPAGDWDVSGVTQFVASGGASMTFMGLWLSKTRQALPQVSSGQFRRLCLLQRRCAVQLQFSYPDLLARFSLPVQTLVYLTALMSFSAGNYEVYGAMRARRAS